jgi:cytochrome c551
MATADFVPVHQRFYIKIVQVIIISFFLTACISRGGGDSSPKFQQYYVQGEQLYLRHCSNCHQKDGSGLGLLYPPLDTSDYMQNNFEDVVCLIRNGKEADLVVNGKSYNQRMPPVPVTDLEVAEIVTYIYNSWSHQRDLVDVKLVSEILNSCDTLSSK